MGTATFSPGTFRQLANSPLGLALWDFLNEPYNIVRMETAIYLGRPAVEPLSPGLLSRFGNDVRQDRVKQMIGSMVRQTIEPLGYRKAPVKRISQPTNMFTSGCCYVEHGRA